jgi:hypothetical protein
VVLGVFKYGSFKSTLASVSWEVGECLCFEGIFVTCEMQCRHFGSNLSGQLESTQIMRYFYILGVCYSLNVKETKPTTNISIVGTLNCVNDNIILQINVYVFGFIQTRFCRS